ncbi:MAG: DUF1552 domain-containing protein [Planctomycetota bacterium]|nr:DUF1552 domain-containing protein [Planctomycetota bacterium]
MRDRRHFLKLTGGASLSLPWFASQATASSSSERKPPRRLAFFYVPIGVVRKAFFPGEANALLPAGNNFDPKKITGRESVKLGVQDFPNTPTLEPLQELKDKVSLITSLDRTFQIGTDVHAQCASCFLSSAAPFSVSTSAWPLARTLDQIVADHIGQDTPFRTIEISCNSHKDNRESIYFDNISWYGTGHVAPSIRNPRKLYQRLFSTSEIDSFRNITDLALADAKDMQRELGQGDRRKFEEYFESIRTIEKQMNRLESLKSELANVTLEEPTDSHLPRGEYIRLMGDMMIVALQSGLTNVASLMIGPERWDTPFLFEGLFEKPMSHHQMSHNQRKFSEQLIEVDKFHMRQYAYMIERMSAIEEADGSSLLDNTLFTYGSGLGDGSTHQYNDLPIIVAGKGGGGFRNGIHLNCEESTPLANLWLTQAQVTGAEIEQFADSNGTIESLLV